MLAIIHNGIAIPVMWDVLGRAGTSTTAQRSALLSRFCAVFGEAAIVGLIADREFIGTAWMTSLAERDIPFILRIKDTFHVRLEVCAEVGDGVRDEAAYRGGVRASTSPPKE